MVRQRAVVIPTKKEAASLLSSCQHLELLPWKGIGRCYSGVLANKSIHIVITGMGVKAAADSTRQLITRFQPIEILHLGLAGALRDNLAIGTLFWVDQVVMVDDKREIRCLASNVWESIKHKLKGEFARGRSVTSHKVIESLEDRQELSSRYGGEIVEMENYGIVSVCHSLLVPISVLRIISDAANTQCRKDFWNNLPRLAERLKVVAEIWVDRSTEQ
ncbi:MAG: hypothetical protein HN353_03140 [Bdellovibrionales bacterium]|nr:hypothetical protein [Bdellovibrionales bacterium]MBT3527098.1 hypothetical protein [Bdellovibrionales bacterium]MBT7669797.1 hypothetical protein [Bdellovibrionales bacterium]MBT7768258.1 hypothetical protein [Bdellovibrionales bacterium]